MSLGHYISEDTIEMFLDGDMTGDVLVEFTARYESDVLLKRRVSDQKALRDQLFLIGERVRLKEQLNVFHDEDLTVLPVYKVEKSAPRKRKSRKVIPLKPILGFLAVAASVTLLIFLGGNLFNSDLVGDSKTAMADYEELAKEEEAPSETVKEMATETVTEIEDVVPVSKKMLATGFVVSQDGYLVTNNHVVGDRIIVKQYTEEGPIQYSAEAVLRDEENDVVLLKINDSLFTRFGVVPFTLSNKEFGIGEKIFTLGYPKQDIVFGDGNISSVTGLRGDKTAYQISIPVNKGNSGCPVFNNRAELVAIVKGKQKETEGTAFAIKSSYVLSLIQKHQEAIGSNLKTPRTNQLATKNRARQIKHISPFVFVVESWK